MKLVHWWTLLGVTGAGLAATFLGQSVWGQLGEKRPLVPLPSMVEPPPNLGDTGLKPFEGPGSTASALLKGDVRKAEKEVLAAVGAELRSGRQQPSVSIEWVGPQSARIHQPMACQLLVRNASRAAVSNVVVRQRLPQDVLCKSSVPPAAHEAGELVWNLGTLAPDEARRIDLDLVSQVRGTVNCQASVTFTGMAAHQIDVREPKLAIKMRSPNKVIAGEPVTLLFALSNPGDGMAEAVKVKIQLPDGLEYPRGKVVEVEVKNLAPKEIRTMQLVCLAKGSGPQKCVVVATAEGGISSEDTAQMDILMPRLDVALSGPKLRYLDRHAVYVAKVVNPGSASATNVEISQVIPAGFKFHQAGQGGHYHEGTRTVSWSIGDLQPGQSREATIDVIPIQPGDHRMIAHAKSARGLKTEAETHTVVEGLPSLLIELADLDDPVEVGAETAYELHVTNTGTKTETNVEVACVLPDQFEFKGAKCSTALRYRLEGREVIFEPLSKLAPKADVIYRIQVRGSTAGDVRFRARVRTDDMKEPIVREERTRIYSDGAPTRSALNTAPAAMPEPRASSNPAPAPPLPSVLPPPTTTAPAPPVTPNFAPAPPPRN